MPITTDILVVVGLLGLNVFQLVFWSRQTGRLIDKLMSRNYAEYKQVEHLASSPNGQTQQAMSLRGDDPVLSELNGMLGGM